MGPEKLITMATGQRRRRLRLEALTLPLGAIALLPQRPQRARFAKGFAGHLAMIIFRHDDDFGVQCRLRR